jgi:CubicO group peptidase (beta-lactamase class C family)
MAWWMMPALLALAAGADAPAVSAEEAARLRQAGAEVLFWSQEQRDANFRTMESIFPTRVVRAGGAPRPLAAGADIASLLGTERIDAFMADQNVAGLIVVHDGVVRLERYARGFSAEQRWTSFSVAKSLTSTLVGAAIADGHIGSLDDPVTDYVPELAGSGYDGVTIAQVLTMTSGVRWNEDYTDPTSDVARMFATPPPEGQDVTVAYLSRLPRAAEPGMRWNYNTAETNLIGVIVSRATGRPLTDYLSETIWRPYGMEADAFWQVDERGHEIAGCCISARLRDYARIGQFMLDGGAAALPEGWIGAATAAQADIGAPGRGYGYQWWTRADGFAAIGIFGQAILIDPERRVVMATLSAWPRPTDRSLSAEREAFFREAVAALD